MAMRLLVVVLLAASGASTRPAQQKKRESLRSTALSIPQRLLAGGTGRTAGQLIMYPADALRTLAQTRAGAKSLSDLGVQTLLSGAATTSIFAYLIGAVQFAIYGTLKEYGALTASVAGAVCSCVVSVPQEVVKQRLVTGIYPNFATAVATIWREQGLGGFYTAWVPTVSRNVPFVVTTFVTFAWLDERCRSVHKNGEPLTVLESMRFGILSALVGGVVTQPFDVVKTRLMTQAASTAAPYAGVLDCVTSMWRTEGIGAFYAGLLQRSLYMGPLWAIQFAVNAAVTEQLEKRNQRAADAVARAL